MNNEKEKLVEEKENIKIKEINEVVNEDEKDIRKGNLFISFFKSKLCLKLIYYIVIIVIALIFVNISNELEIELGDFGSIVPMLLHSLSFMGFKWLPILSVIGIVLIFFENKFKEISKVYLISTFIITVVSLLIQFII